MGINLRASRCGYCLRIAVVNEVPAAGWSQVTATPLSTVDCPRLVRRRTTKCQHRPTVRRVIRPAPFPLSLTVTDSQSRVGGSGSTSRVQGLHRPTRTVTADDHDAERRTVGRPRRADAVHEWPPDGPVTRLGRRVDAGHFTALPTPPGCSATVPSSPAGYERCRGVESPRSRPGTTQREPLHP